jgi:mevalonate kinase
MSFLAEKINQSHLYLQRLGVSTEQLDQIVFQLKQAGALAAKLTGAGGGGLVLGIFQNEPQHLFQFFNKNDIFVTKVTGDN